MLSLYLLVALLFFSVHRWQISWAIIQNDSRVDDAMVLNYILDAEINATNHQLKLNRHKTELLRDAIKLLESQDRYTTSKRSTGSSNSKSASIQQQWQRYRKFPHFFDWFEPRDTYSLGNSSHLMTRLISFRPNIFPMKKQQQGTIKRSNHINEQGPLQFLLVLDRDSTALSLVHPISFELVWKHELDLSSLLGNNATFLVADMFFVSDHSAHLAILSTSGNLALFKLRLWFNRRIIAGDYRRLEPINDFEKNRLQCPLGQKSLNKFNHFQSSWWHQASYLLTTPSTGKYLHVDVERVFGVTLDPAWHYDRGKVAVVTQHRCVIVVVSDNFGSHLSFFHGGNGTFIKSIDTHVNSHVSNVIQLEPLKSGGGLLAQATQSQVLFVDTRTTGQIPVLCESPGRHMFSSLAADPLRRSIVYAGTSTGRAFVYKLHNFGQRRDFLSNQEPHPVAICVLADQLMSRWPSLGHEEPAVVQTLPGFFLLGIGSRLVLYQLHGNFDEVHPVYLSERLFGDVSGQDIDRINRTLFPDPQILDISVSKDLALNSAGFALFVVNSNGSYQMDIFESRVLAPGMNLDLIWIRVPAMMVCALAAMYWQKRGWATFQQG